MEERQEKKGHRGLYCSDILSHIKRDDTIVRKVVTKSVTDDRLMLTDVIIEECLNYSAKKRAKVSKEEMYKTLKDLSDIINISPIPPDKELSKMYKICDPNDLKILTR